MNKLKSQIFDKTMLKFMLVGVINTIVGCGTMLLLYNLAGCSYWISSASNYIVGGICSYFLNKYFTFQNRERSWKQVGKFILTIAVCYCIGYGLAKPLTKWILSGYSVKIQENIAMLAGMGIYIVLNYLGQRFFTFKK